MSYQGVSAANFNVNYVHFLLCIICYSSLAFSPLLTFLFSVLGFFFSNKERFFYIYLVPYLLSFSIIASSRSLFSVFSDDFETYYEVFKSLDVSFFYFYSELMINVLNYFIKLLFGDLKPRSLLFVYCLSSSFVLSLSVYKLIRNSLGSSNFIFKLFSIFAIFLPFFAPTIFVRQYFSIVFFIAYLSVDRGGFKYFLLFISFLFHHSIIVIAGLLYLFFYHLKGWARPTFFILTSLALGWGFSEYFSTLLSDFPKIRAWIVLNNDFSFSVFIGNYFSLIVTLLFSVLFYKNSYFPICRLLTLSITTALAVDVIFPYVSLRIFLILFVALGGVLAYIAYNSKFRNELLFLFFVIGFSKQVSLQIFGSGTGYASIYSAYPAFSTEPFYYLDAMLQTLPQRNRQF